MKYIKNHLSDWTPTDFVNVTLFTVVLSLVFVVTYIELIKLN